jgi:RHS repeat-associated protein
MDDESKISCALGPPPRDGKPFRASFPGADPHKIPIDSNGNLTTKTEGPDTWGYEWNARNELTRVTKNSVEQARFTYDPLGRRVEKAVGGVATSYVYDGASIVREIRATAQRKYVHGFGMDEPLAWEEGAALSYFHADGLGSVVRVSSSTGDVSSARQYDAWGNLEVGSGDSGFAYTGREWDPETGLYYYRARYYDAKAGRFLSQDPLGLLAGINLFAYVLGNPVVLTDPSGFLTVTGKGQEASYRGVPWINDKSHFWPQKPTVNFKCTERCEGWQLEFTAEYEYTMLYPTCCPEVEQEERAHKAGWEAATRAWAAPAAARERTYPSKAACEEAGKLGRSETMTGTFPEWGHESHGWGDRVWKWFRDTFLSK